MTDTSFCGRLSRLSASLRIKKYPSQTAYSAAAAGERGRADG